MFSLIASSSFSLTDYRLKLKLLKSSLDKLRETKPRINNGMFVRLMLGQVNMVLWKQADRIRFKGEEWDTDGNRWAIALKQAVNK